MGHREVREVSLLILLFWYLMGKESLCIKYIVGFKHLFVSPFLPTAPPTNPGLGYEGRTVALSVVHMIVSRVGGPDLDYLFCF